MEGKSIPENGIYVFTVGSKIESGTGAGMFSENPPSSFSFGNSLMTATESSDIFSLQSTFVQTVERLRLRQTKPKSISQWRTLRSK